jgi:hypothetical protein
VAFFVGPRKLSNTPNFVNSVGNLIAVIDLKIIDGVGHLNFIGVRVIFRTVVYFQNQVKV